MALVLSRNIPFCYSQVLDSGSFANTLDQERMEE